MFGLTQLKRRLFIALVVALILLGTGATWALAQSDGAINACVLKDGTLRIVADPLACKKGETLLTWNLLGPEGPQGETGPAGPDGPAGLQGEAGPAGLSCWDLNGDGIQDPAEDINQDGLWNTADCKGPKGDTAIGKPCDALTLGAVFLHPGPYPPPGTMRADGTILPINQNQALFSLIGITYGGNGLTTFALPDLTDAAPNGVPYVICVTGPFPMPPAP